MLILHYFDIDFVNFPDKASEYDHALPIMIWGMKYGIFTTRKLSDFINKTGVDYEGARRVINGQDKKELIASYAIKFEAILRETSSLTENFNND